MTSAGATRWCVTGVPPASRPVSIAYSWAAPPPAVTSYRITSASDYPARDPRSWTLQGCDGELQGRRGRRLGHPPHPQRRDLHRRHQTKTYPLDATRRLRPVPPRVTANTGDTTAFQLGELQLF